MSFPALEFPSPDFSGFRSVSQGRRGGRSSDLFIIDSHFAYDHINTSVQELSSIGSYDFQGRVYRGRSIVEYAQHVTTEEKERVHLWASIDNDISVLLQERDVVAEMYDQNFYSVERLFPNKSYETNNPDQPTLVFKAAY